MKDHPRVIIIILNSNRGEDTLATLNSLAQSNYPNQHTIVLDNASTDGSIEAIQLNFPNVQIINLEHNLGYGGNNNQGIQIAMEQQADWIFVLNEDTIVDPNCIHKLVETASLDQKIGMIGPLVYHYDEPSSHPIGGWFFR